MALVALWLFFSGLLWVGVAHDEPDAIPDNLAPIILTDTPGPTPYVPRYAGGYLQVSFSGGFDAILTPTPVPSTPAPVPGVQYFAESVVEYEFLDGWNDGGGAALKSPASVSRWITCESNWHITTPYSLYYGLAQFSGSTWANAAESTGLWDYWSAYAQGFNSAWHALNGTVDPGGTGGWPVCWHR